MPGQTRECEAGNETYARQGKQLIGNVPGNQGTETEEQPKGRSDGGGRRPEGDHPPATPGRLSPVRAGTIAVSW